MKNFFALKIIFNELKIPQHGHIIKVIGTNGKGSTGRFLAQMLENYEGKNPGFFAPNCPIPEAFRQENEINLDEFFCQFGWPKFLKNEGKKNTKNLPKNLEKNAQKNHLKIAHFSSPHLLSFYERFYCNYLDSQTLAKRCNKALWWINEQLKTRPFLKEFELNFFDYLCLIFSLVFYDANLQIIEAGIGAKHDSTRVYEGFLNLITSISFDHFEYFKNLLEIYYEKSCIKGAIIAYENNPYLPILRAFGQEIYLLNDSQICAKKCLEKSYVLKQNFKLANLAYKFLLGSFYEGAKISLKLPARRQILRGALVDCAHNEDAISKLVNEYKNQRFLCYLALKNTKENALIIARISPICRAFVALNKCAENELLKARNLEFLRLKKPPKKARKNLQKICQKNPKKFAKKKRLKKLNIFKAKKRLKGALFCGSFDAARLANSLFAN